LFVNVMHGYSHFELIDSLVIELTLPTAAYVTRNRSTSFYWTLFKQHISDAVSEENSTFQSSIAMGSKLTRTESLIELQY